MKQALDNITKCVAGILKEVAELKKSCEETKLSDLKPGETFMIADYEFIVLEHTAAGTKVITKGLWQEDSIEYGESKDYRVSGIKEFIGKNVLPVLVEAVGEENVIEHDVDLTALDGGNDFGTIRCKVHPIEFMEARKHYELLVNEDLPDWWWTITPWNSRGIGYTKSLVVVSPSGDICSNDFNSNFGVRPFCILKSDIFVSLKN